MNPAVFTPDSAKIRDASDATRNLAVSAAGEASVADANLGAKADAAASSDSGTFSLIALFKRLLAGITSLVSQTNLTKGAGAADATTLRAVLASDGPTVSALGATTDAAVGDATGSINAHLRQLAKLAPALGQAAAASSVPVVPASDYTPPPPTNRTGTGNLTALNQAVTVNAQGCSVVMMASSGTFSATLSFEGTIDGATWFAMQGYVATGGSSYGGPGSTADSNTVVNRFFPVGGILQFRVRCSAYTSGTAVVALTAGPSALPVSNQVVANQSAMTDGWSNSGAGLSTNLIGSWEFLGVKPMLFNGATWDRRRVPASFKDMSAIAIGSIATVWTPASGKKFRLMGGTFSVDAAVSVLFEDNSAGAGNFVFRTPVLQAGVAYSLPANLGNGKLSAAANNVLKATASGSANITGTLFGTEE